MTNFLKGYENIAQARVTAALVLKIKLAEFENLKQLIKNRFSRSQNSVSAGLRGETMDQRRRGFSQWLNFERVYGILCWAAIANFLIIFRQMFVMTVLIGGLANDVCDADRE